MIAPKLAPTSLNLYALAELATKLRAGPVFRVPSVDAPHLSRCIKAGLLVSSRERGLELTDAGRAKLAENTKGAK